MKKDTFNKPPVSKNDDITLDITAMGSDAQGIGRVDGFTVFVPGALEGERVDAHVIKLAKGYAVAKLMRIDMESSDRVAPSCIYFSKCGGCSLMHMSRASQLAFKRERVASAFSRIGGIECPDVLEPLGSRATGRDRNKGSFPMVSDGGVVRTGFFAPMSHRLVPIEDCLMHDEAVVSAALAVRDWANECEIKAYDEESGAGLLRHCVARVSSTGEVMAIVVTAGGLPHRDELIEMLIARVNGLSSIVHNVNSRRTNAILGERFTTVWGSDHITHELLGLKLKVGAGSFLQVNHAMTEALYSQALEFAGVTPDDVVLDAYCGIGSITLCLAKRAGRVTGVESVASSIDSARENAALNGIENVDFICAAVEDVLPGLVEDAGQEGPRFDVVVLDPPRRGCAPGAIEAIARSGARRIVYISCDPATLARDVKLLCARGYAFDRARPVDMFPNTAEVETVCLLSKPHSEHQI